MAFNLILHNLCHQLYAVKRVIEIGLTAGLYKTWLLDVRVGIRNKG